MEDNRISKAKWEDLGTKVSRTTENELEGGTGTWAIRKDDEMDDEDVDGAGDNDLRNQKVKVYWSQKDVPKWI